MSLTSIFIMSILTQNIVLTNFLGICPFIGTSSKEKSAVGMGLCVMLIVTVASILSFSIYHLILVPTGTTYLKTILFILVIASCVQLLEMAIRKYQPDLYRSLGIYLPLITTNCAVLGTVLLVINHSYTFMETIIFSVGSSLGFTLVIYVFSTMRERIDRSDVPSSLKGYPIALVTAAIMALLFSRYGLV